jgi:hypothetical protein
VRFVNVLVPQKYANAETSEPGFANWAGEILAGRRARVLALGPTWSGKTHNAYAALRRLLAGGYPADGIAMYKALSLGRVYVPPLIHDGPSVIVLDDITIAVDINERVTDPSVPDRPDIAAMRGRAGRTRTVVPRLPDAAVWAIDANGLVVRPGPRLVDGVEAIAAILHPDAVPAPPPGTIARIT